MRYKCHKEVEAFKIADIKIINEQSFLLVAPPDLGIQSECVSAQWCATREPEIGDYFVRYEDGYTSCSPAKAFEEGYTEVKLLPDIYANNPTELFAKIENWFSYHPPEGDQAARYESIRKAAGNFAKTLACLCPESADLTVAIRKVREAVMVANASIACGGV